MTIVTNQTSEESYFCSGETIITGDSGVEWLRLNRNAWGLVFTSRGQGHIILNNDTFTVNRGDATLLTPDCIPAFRSSSDWSILWFRFLLRPHLADKMSSLKKHHSFSIAHLGESEFRPVLRTLLEAHHLGFRRERGWFELAYLLLETVLIRIDNRLPTSETETDRRIVLAQKLLTATGNQLSIDKIAERCGMSRSVLYIVFKQNMGVTPHQYREINLFNRAKQLLENTSWPITEVAKLVGIEDPYYFSTRFKHFCGMSPSAFRESKKIIPRIGNRCSCLSCGE